ncbi:MAG: helix-turn-helix domain-containing protein [Desulfovibrio sp.]|nr:helix-turn-helix domain-containing protein [Desulfovibrio sp.]
MRHTNNQPSLLESAIEILRQAVSGRPFANQAQLARASGESEANISRWLSGASTPTLRRLEPVLMALGVRFAMPGEVAPALPGRRRPHDIDIRPDHWRILDRADPLPDILALEVQADDRSMQPTLCPGDMVLVDTRRTAPLHEGQIYLVREPDKVKGACMFRRLSLPRGHRFSLMVLSPDNPAGGYTPIVKHVTLSERPEGFILGLVVKSITTMAPRAESIEL